MRRRIRERGEVIDTHEGFCYRVLATVSSEGMSIVYRAELLVDDNETQDVLLKAYVMPERFRDENEYREYTQHELLMNKEINSIIFSGAMTIKYMVHGKEDEVTYGVITDIRPGITLQEYVNSPEFIYATLRDRIAIIRKLSSVIDKFHEKCRMIHGDISPDNIYIVESASENIREYNRDVLLLDFGSARHIFNQEDIPIYSKIDYIPVDVAQGQRKKLNSDDDWYGVVCCLWYCFTGYTMSVYPPCEANINEVYNKIAVVYEANNFGYITDTDEEVNFIRKRIKNSQIVLKKVQELFWERVSYTSHIIDKLRVIQDILEDTGISTERLFVKLKEEYDCLRNNRFSSLHILTDILPNVKFNIPQSTPRFIRTQDKKPETLHQIVNKNKESLFMIGDGGMGKTTSLIEIMDYVYRNPEEIGAPVIFIELSVLSQDYNDWYTRKLGGTFIEQFIASYFLGEPRKFAEKNNSYIAPIREELFRLPKDGNKKYTVLLDGLNEVGFISEKSKSLFYETVNKYLKYAKNLRLIITGRNDAYELSTEELLRLKTLGLDDKNIIDILNEAVSVKKISEIDVLNLIQKKDDISTNENRLWNCLKIPFFLMMYCMSSNKKNVESQGEILRNFFHDKREILGKEFSYGEQQQAQLRYQRKKYDNKTELSMEYALKAMLDFIIPEIAISMVEKNYFFITEDKLYRVIEECFFHAENMVRPQRWTEWYYKYSADIREIFAEIKKSDRGRKIPDDACHILGIMKATANNTYFFTHQYFRDYFAACALINRMLEVIESREYAKDGWYAESPAFSKQVAPLHSQQMPEYVCALVGEILGERKNIPVYDISSGRWSVSKERTNEQNVLIDFLHCYRNVKDDVAEVQIGLNNIITILKKSRIRNDGHIDFSGIDFSEIDISKMSLSGIVFSHFDVRGIYKAKLDKTTGFLEAILHDDRQQIVRCCGIHPIKRKILLYNEDSNLLTELNIENGEKTNLFGVFPGDISAYYVGSQDNILIIRIRMDNAEVEYDDTSIDEAEKRINAIHNATVEIDYYFRKNHKIAYYGYNAIECLGAEYSDEYNEISLFMKTEQGIELMILELELSYDFDGSKIKENGPYILPLDTEYSNQIERNTFMFTRINKENYLLSDSKISNCNVGKWNIEDDFVQSICYLEHSDDKIRSFSVCCDDVNEKIYFLRNDENIDVIDQEKIHSNEVIGEWSMNARKTEKICVCSALGILLILSNGILKAYNMQERKILWNCEALSVIQMFSGNGIVIVNTNNGIYEINIDEGDTRCLQLFRKDKIEYVLGRTSNGRDVLLYDTTGIIKWINVENGCCYRQLAVQCTDEIIEDVFYDEDKNILYGISGIKIYLWDGWSGTRFKVLDVKVSKEWKLIFSEFNHIRNSIQMYFERIDYQNFPARKKYFMKEWALEEGELIPYKKGEKEREILFRYIYSEEGKMLAKECLYNNKRQYNEEVDNKRKSSRETILRFLPLNRNGYEIEDENIDEIIWDTKFGFEKSDIKRVYYLVQKRWKRIADIEGDKQIIGGINGEILYSVSRDAAGTDMKLFSSGKEELIKLGNNFNTEKFVDIFMVKNTVVGLLQDISHTHKDRVCFWNINTNDLYDYEITDKIYAVGCNATFTKKEEKFACMEGLCEPAVHWSGNIERFENKKAFKTVEIGQLMKQWNYPAVFGMVLLTILDLFMYIHAYSGIDDKIYYIEKYISTCIASLAVIVAVKVVYPGLVSLMQYRNEHIELLMLIITSLIPYLFFGYLRNIDMIKTGETMSVFFAIPFIWTFLYECPAENSNILGLGIICMTWWIWAILQETPQSMVIKLEIISFIIFSGTYMLRMYRFYIEGKEQFKKTMLRVIIFLLGALILAWISMRAKQVRWDRARFYEIKAQWSVYINHITGTVLGYRLWGKMNGNCREDLEFYENFTLNYAIEHYGWIYGIVIMLISVLILYFMWKGAKQQLVLIDRCACISCALYLTIETMVSFLQTLGIVIIPPCTLPFWGGTLDTKRLAWVVFGIYMTFYQAHRSRDDF